MYVLWTRSRTVLIPSLIGICGTQGTVRELCKERNFGSRTTWSVMCFRASTNESNASSGRHVRGYYSSGREESTTAGDQVSTLLVPSPSFTHTTRSLSPPPPPFALPNHRPPSIRLTSGRNHSSIRDDRSERRITMMLLTVSTTYLVLNLPSYLVTLAFTALSSSWLHWNYENWMSKIWMRLTCGAKCGNESEKDCRCECGRHSVRRTRSRFEWRLWSSCFTFSSTLSSQSTSCCTRGTGFGPSTRRSRSSTIPASRRTWSTRRRDLLTKSFPATLPTRDRPVSTRLLWPRTATSEFHRVATCSDHVSFQISHSIHSAGWVKKLAEGCQFSSNGHNTQVHSFYHPVCSLTNKFS